MGRGLLPAPNKWAARPQSMFLRPPAVGERAAAGIDDQRRFRVDGP